MSHPPSIVISRLLNDLGYSYEHIVSRREYFAAMDPDTIMCGSKREGTSHLLENDFDGMCVVPSVECFEIEEGLQNSNVPIKFQLTRSSDTAPGYALLKLVPPVQSVFNESRNIYKCLAALYGGYLLLSDDLKQQLKESCVQEFCEDDDRLLMCRDNQGPSCPVKFFDGLINMDAVLAIPCNCPDLVSSWRNRPRPYDWPSRELINEVSSLQAHVVPVGYKGSPMQYLEWRICFTLGEIRLIESLNECQIKLLILLKFLAKEELKPICQNMTSYVMKNLVLWLAESNPSGEFQECNLIGHVINALKVLKHCINKINLPSYMIESRNLFADRITNTEAEQLCQKIDTLIDEGPKMLLRCPKIRDGLALFRTDPDKFIYLSQIRQLLLTQYLSQIRVLLFTKYQPGKLDFTQQSGLGQVLLPDLNSLESKGLDIENILIQRCKYFLS